MGKYSSDSDYERGRSKRSHKSSSRRRSSSSESVDSRKSRRNKDRKTDRHRTRSRDRYSKSSRRSRSRSSSHHKSYKSKSYKRSNSRSRDPSPRYKRSSSKDRRRSHSRDKYSSRSRRSRSKSYIREYTAQKPKRRTTSSSSSSSSSDDSVKIVKVEQRKSNSKDSSNDVPKLKFEEHAEMPSVDRRLLDEINEDKFTQKAFSSGRKVPETIVIDLQKQTIKVPEVEPSEPDTVFHHNLFLSEETRSEKWIKELYSYRQKALQQGLKSH